MAKKTLRLLVDSYDQLQPDENGKVSRDSEAVNYTKGDTFEPRDEKEYERLIEIEAAEDPQETQKRREQELEAESQRLQAERARLDDELSGLRRQAKGYDSLKVEELRGLATERGLDVPEDAKKADLVEALERHDVETG